MMNISPIVNSVKCTVFSRFVQFSHGLEGSTILARKISGVQSRGSTANAP